MPIAETVSPWLRVRCFIRAAFGLLLRDTSVRDDAAALPCGQIGVLRAHAPGDDEDDARGVACRGHAAGVPDGLVERSRDRGGQPVERDGRPLMQEGTGLL